MRVAVPSRKVTVWSVSTGEALERWPVDAAELVASGGYTMHDPSVPVADGAGQEMPSVADPEAARDALALGPLPDGLEKKTKAQVEEYARAVLGLTFAGTPTKRTMLDAVAAHLHANA